MLMSTACGTSMIQRRFFPPEQVVHGQVRVHDAGSHHAVQVLHELRGRVLHAHPIQSRVDESWRGHRAVTDVLHQHAVGGPRNRERDGHARIGEAFEHRELVVGPVVPQHQLPVARLLRRRAPVATVAERAAVSVRAVVHEVRDALEAELLQLTLVRHVARPVALVREQARATIGRDALDEEHLCFFAGLQRPEVVFVVHLGFGDQPWHAACNAPASGVERAPGGRGAMSAAMSAREVGSDRADSPHRSHLLARTLNPHMISAPDAPVQPGSDEATEGATTTAVADEREERAYLGSVLEEIPGTSDGA